MASLTIRNLDDGVKRGLRIRAAERGHSMEEEAREILKQAVRGEAPVGNLGLAIHHRFAALGGVELNLPERSTGRDIPDFE